VIGEQLRDLVLHGGHVSPWAEALSYAAARAQHVDEVIRPALERGAAVVCDRYLDSSVAYQGVGRELGLERVLDLNLAAVGGLVPDRTFLLVLDAADAGRRLSGEHDRLERESKDFHARAADGYRELATRFPERIVVLDATRPAKDLAEEVYGAFASVPEAARGSVCSSQRWRREVRRHFSSTALPESGSGQPRSRSQPRCSATIAAWRHARIRTCISSSRWAR
jgi:dTMP kinase